MSDAGSRAGESFSELAEGCFRSLPDSLTVHLTNAPAPLCWDRRARDLLLGIVRNKYLHGRRTRRALGHISVEVSSTDARGEPLHRMTGQGALDLGEYTRKIRREGLGFGIMLTAEHVRAHPQLRAEQLVTIRGALEQPEDLAREYDRAIWKKDLMGFVTYRLDREACARVVGFMDEYAQVTDRTRDSPTPLAGNNYGFGGDVHAMEGAGCATYAQRVFELAGLGEHYRHFFEKVFVPARLIGDRDAGERVPLWRILTDRARLSDPGEGRLELDIPNPERMYRELRDAAESGATDYRGLQVGSAGMLGNTKAYHLVFEAP